MFIDCHALRPLIAELSDRDRHVLHMRFYEDKTQLQIGLELGIPQMQVSRHLTRVLMRLRQALNRD